MINSSKFLANLKEYKVVAQDCWKEPKNIHKFIKADWNESPLPPTPKIKQALIKFITNYPLHWYPDIEARQLKKKLSVYTKNPISYIQVFNGSDSALEYIAKAYITPGDEVIMRLPTYDNFRVYVESCGAKLIKVLCQTPFIFQEQPIINKITNKTKIIYLVNPNNPSGAVIKKGQLIKILKAAKNTLVIVDEAYFEFYGISMAAMVKQYNNLMIVRSFSKAFSLAGLRCGYVVSQPQNIGIINKIRVGKNVNRLAQIAAITALQDQSYYKKIVQEIIRARKYIMVEFKKRKLLAVETPANFVLLKIKHHLEFIDFLKKNFIYIRNVSNHPQLEGFVRITIGNRRQMAKIISVLDAFIKIHKQHEF